MEEHAVMDAKNEELVIEAEKENLDRVMDFVNSRLESICCPPDAQIQIDIAVEEIFINIASYAYAPDKGHVTVRVELFNDPMMVTITFMDHGVPFNPLARKDPDVNLPINVRNIGGLGIFMTKKLMDDMQYTYLDGRNILTLKKKL